MANENDSNEFEKYQEHPETVSLKNKITGMSKETLKKTADNYRLENTQLAAKIDQFKKLREDHNAEARHYRTLRNNTSDDKFALIEQLQEEANSEKEKRDNCNEQIKANKQRREELNVQVKTSWVKVKDLRDKYYKIKNEVGILPEEITNQIRELEWEQQTTTLPPEEDVLLTKRIAELYEKAYTVHETGFSIDILEKAIDEAKHLSHEHEEAHQNVVDFAEKGQQHHQRMIELYKKIDSFRADGSSLHAKYLEARQAADLAHQKIVELYNRINLNQYLMEIIEEEQRRRRHEESMKTKIEKDAKIKKKQSNKKMTLEDLKALLGNDENENDNNDE